jgi:integrase
MKGRRRGTGTVERHRDGWRGRLPYKGRPLPVCETYEQAERELDAAIYELVSAGALGLTLKSFGPGWLAERRKAGLRSCGTDESRWHRHVASHPIAAVPMRNVTRTDVKAWLDDIVQKKVAPGRGHKSAPNRKLSRSMIQGTLNLLRSALATAADREFIGENPAREVRLERDRGATHEPWTYLLPHEQSALLSCEGIPVEARLLYAFSIGTGLRQGEQWNLELRDVQKGVVVVRYGGKGKQTKSGKIRRVPLFGMAAEALRDWLPLLATQPNPHGLVWPLPSGSRRQRGKADKGWKQHLRAAGIVAAERHDGRAVRHHDMRHTAGSSLVAGWWGRRWTLEEVRALLGHSTVKMTERYAHLGETALAAAARGTTGFDAHTTATQTGISSGAVEQTIAFPSWRSRVRTSCPAPTKQGDPQRDDAAPVWASGGRLGAEVARLARRGLKRVEDGGAGTWAEVTRIFEELERIGTAAEDAARVLAEAAS